MGLLGAIRDFYRLPTEQRALTPAQAWARDIEWGDGPTASGERVTQDSALGLATVFACTSLIADMISTLPVDVYRKGADGFPVAARPRPLWLDEPVPNDPSITRAVHFAQVVLSLLYDGNAYILASPGVYDPRVLEVLDPRRVRVQATNRLRPTYRVGNAEYTTGRIIHIPRTRRPGELVGLSPIDEAKESLGVAMAAQKHAGRFYRNGALMSTVIKVPGEMSEQDALQLREDFQKGHSRDNVFRVGVLTGGADATSLSVTPEQAQFLETTRFHVVEICRIFRVPPMLVGVNEPGAVSYASSEQAVKAFHVNTLAPLLTLLQMGYQRLLPDSSQYLMFDVNGLLRADPQTRYGAYEAGLRGGFLSRNEVRAWEELPPIEGEGGDIYTVQAQMVTLDQVAAPPPEPPPAAPPPPEGGESESPLAGRSARSGEQRHPGHSPQSVHAGKGNISLAEQGVKGGFTASTHGDVPKDGLMVSPYKGRERKYSAAELDPGDVREYKRRNADVLGRPNHFIGGWRDGDTVYLDVSVRATSRAEALKLAKANDQLAVYDLGSGQVIDTPDLVA